MFKGYPAGKNSDITFLPTHDFKCACHHQAWKLFLNAFVLQSFTQNDGPTCRYAGVCDGITGWFTPDGWHTGPCEIWMKY